MSLEEDIKVSKFRNPRHRLAVNLMFTNNWMTSKMQEVFRAHSITNQQYNILRILRGAFPDPCNIQELKARMLDKQPDVSRLVDRLFNKGLVHRKVNKVDRRKMDITIAPQGLELLSNMEEDVNRFERFFDGLDDREVGDINVLLDKIRDKCEC